MKRGTRKLLKIAKRRRAWSREQRVSTATSTRANRIRVGAADYRHALMGSM